MRIMPTELTRENDPDYEYIPDPLGRLGRGTWRRRRKFDPFGRIEINPEFENFRAGFDLAKPLGRIFPDRTPDIAAPVGREGENERFDVALIETLLAKAGFFDLARTEGPTGYYGSDLDDAVRRFQKTENLKVDGLVNPGGPTLAALTARLAAAENARDGGDRENKEEKDDGTDKGSDGGNSGDGQNQDPENGDRKPPDLLEAAMRGGRRKGLFLPPPVMPGGKPGRAKPRRQLPAEDESDPNADQARREALADEFVKEITKPLEAHRGDATTKKGNDIVAQECRQVLEENYPDFATDIEHVGGANEDGKGRKLSEKFVPNRERKALKQDARPGSSHPDLTWQDTRKDDEDPSAFAHANTATLGKRGKPIAEERESYQRLVENVGETLATSIPKLRPGMDEEKYRKDVRAKCQEIFEKWLGKPRGGAPDSDENRLSAP